MRAVFRICGNESHSGLQLVEKLAMPLPGLKKKAGVKNLFSPFLLSYFEKIAHASVVEAFVSLWLCLLGCVLQGPIRLKVL